MFTRRLKAIIKYNNKDISDELSKYLLSINFSDAISGEADTLDIQLEDKDKLWQGAWLPDKGAVLDASIIQTYWTSNLPDPQLLPLGLFEIDEIESNSPPSTVTIKAVSVPNNNTLRGIDRTRAWEKTKLQTIAQDIAKAASLQLYYDTAENPVLDRAEQTEQSDLSFLQGLCQNAGMALKVADQKIIIFDEAMAEQVAPKITLVKPESGYVSTADMTYYDKLLSYSFKSKVRDVYAACRLDYQDEKTKKKITYTFNAPGKTGKTLVINEQVESTAEAERLTKMRLREKNCEEQTASFTMLGRFDLLSGVTFAAKGFGAFDGIYIIIRSNHNFGGGYTTGIEARRILNGY